MIDCKWGLIDTNKLHDLWNLEKHKKLILNEKTYKEVAYMIDPDFLKQRIRASELRGSFFDSFNNDIMLFKVDSSDFTNNGIRYDVEVEFSMWEEMKEHRDMTPTDRARLLLWYSDIHYRCNCPSFQYHYAYVATLKDLILEPIESRPAPIRNPRHRGVGCKHINKMLRVLPFNAMKIATEMKKQDHL